MKMDMYPFGVSDTGEAGFTECLAPDGSQILAIGKILHPIPPRLTKRQMEKVAQELYVRDGIQGSSLAKNLFIQGAIAGLKYSQRNK